MKQTMFWQATSKGHILPQALGAALPRLQQPIKGYEEEKKEEVTRSPASALRVVSRQMLKISMFSINVLEKGL